MPGYDVQAPLPPLGFGIGIVGHRPDRLVDQPAIARCLGRLFGVVEEALGATAAKGGHGAAVPPRLVSALAEGADRIAARVALARGMALVAVLPFAADVYEGDFADAAARDEFRQLVAAAQASVVLDGEVAARERAYDRAGLVLLENVDLLIAVWDGGPGRGRGGTREVIEEAARRGVPVVTVSTDGLQVELRSASLDAYASRFADLPRLPEARLEGLVAELVSLPDGKSAVAEWAWLSRLPSFGVGHRVYPALLRLAGAGSAKSASPMSAAGDALSEAFGWWDAAAVEAAQAFRSAVIVNFGLAALAVVLAAGSVLAGHWKWVFVLLEVVTILLLLANTVVGRRRNWQDRWLESREVAELLRVASIQRYLAIGRIAGVGDGGWASAYVTAFTRAAPLRSIDLSNPAASGLEAIEAVRRQSAWNAATAGRMHRAAHRIERFGEILFGIVLLAAVIWLGLCATLPQVAAALKYPLTALSAGLPAVATASYGIRVIIDFEGIAERSHRIAAGLTLLLDRLDAGPRSAEGLQGFCRAASATMIADVASWRLLAEGRRLAIPG
ncbi:hypothetical protein GGQ88_001307 [Novosphingobium hassiacum]|uniref:Uncharacterized protein n=1 Tax=Novosphingobium hassiacum TaxID=173676 RepID=A0A7W5ZU82_9SPHN|nr:hypothetical protein [Novosphingobium hassiacum]MBB3860046.1 hypothetical protein [Novosphingobium hassiacum]